MNAQSRRVLEKVTPRDFVDASYLTRSDLTRDLPARSRRVFSVESSLKRLCLFMSTRLCR